jgi:hypothetical protein
MNTSSTASTKSQDISDRVVSSLSVAEVVHCLGVEPHTVLRYISSGYPAPGGQKIKLVACKVPRKTGRAWRVLPADLTAFQGHNLVAERGDGADGLDGHSGHPGTAAMSPSASEVFTDTNPQSVIK